MPSGLANLISIETIRKFYTDGVVVLRGVLTEEDVASLAAGIDEIFVNRNYRDGFFDLTEVAEAFLIDGEDVPFDPTVVDQAAQGKFLLDTGTWMRSQKIKDIATNSVIPAVCGALLKTRFVNFYDDQALVKESRSKEVTAMHRDFPYFHLEGRKICAVWVPVDPVNEASGGLVYVKGSHTWPGDYAANIFVSQKLRPGAVGAPLPSMGEMKSRHDVLSFEMNIGDVIVHNARTVHGASGNSSSYDRRAISLRYCGDDVVYAPKASAPHPAHHKHDLQSGDVLQGDQFPIVWKFEDSVT